MRKRVETAGTDTVTSLESQLFAELAEHCPVHGRIGRLYGRLMFADTHTDWRRIIDLIYDRLGLQALWEIERIALIYKRCLQKSRSDLS